MHSVGIDIGGTFTDVVVLHDSGEVRVLKLPSTPPGFEQAIVTALAQLAADGFSPEQMSVLAHGTTVVANTLLEQRGARVALLTTEGFRDVLELGEIRRPSLIDPDFEKPRPLVKRRDRLEVRERVAADGEVITPVDEKSLEHCLRAIDGVDAVAVSLLNAYANPAHERFIRQRINDLYPNLPVSLSSDVLPELGEYRRTSTTAVNAYVQPVVRRYVDTLEREITVRRAPCRLQIMQSNGCMCGGATAGDRPVTIVESGPAAGVAAAIELTNRAGLARALTLDMGGTTAKACMIEDGVALEAHQHEVGGGMNHSSLLSSGGGYVIGAPSIDIAEVGAGGGSQFWIDGAGHPQVGPESSGAVPGPVSYGLGGDRVTVTDANVQLGYIASGAIAGGTRSISLELAAAAVEEQVADPLGMSVDEAAYGVHQIANANMVAALRSVSTERGRDPRDFALIAFGGAGPLHAVDLAQALNIRTVVVPLRAGVFSAIGLLSAPIRHDFSAPWRGGTDVQRLLDDLRELRERAEHEVSSEAADVSGLVIEYLLDFRYVGQAHTLTVPLPDELPTEASVQRAGDEFHDVYARRYGYSAVGDATEIVNLRVRVSVPRPAVESSSLFSHVADGSRVQGPRHRDAYFGPDVGWVSTPSYTRAAFGVESIIGPLLIDDVDTTTVVPPGWTAAVDHWGNVVITDERAEGPASGEVELALLAAEVDPITAEVVRNALVAAADEMALTVIRTARSQIVRDTMDFSTAILDGDGRLVALGLTLLLQLGSIPDAMRTIHEKYEGDINPDDLFIGNDPSEGGMHLPDIYLFKPIFGTAGIVAWSVTIAQHADVGGAAAGSTSPASREIYQEGLQIPFVKLAEQGQINETLVEVIKRNVRVPEIVWADIRSQIAACERGEAGIRRIIERHGEELLARVMERTLDATEDLVRRELQTLPPGRYAFVDHVDEDGFGSGPIPIRVTVVLNGGSVEVDFTGTGSQVRSALNSTLSFTKAAVYAAIVWALGRRENLNNEGLFRAVTVTAPEGTIVNGRHPVARAARSTTGFRVIDAVLGAMHQVVPDRVPAAGEGGLCHVAFGGRTDADRSVAFVDVFSAGWGGRPARDGIDGTSPIGANLASTPIEMIERYHPVRVGRCAFVPDSAGAGQYRGGLAVERSYTFLGSEGTMQVRSDRRRFRPYGLAGGQAGAPSDTILVTPTGEERQIPSKAAMDIDTGVTVRQITPGSGGYGDPCHRDPQLVFEDVVDGKVSIIRARSDYHVIVDTEAGTAIRTMDSAT